MYVYVPGPAESGIAAGLPAPLKLVLVPRIQGRQARLVCRRPARQAHSEVGHHRANNISSMRANRGFNQNCPVRPFPATPYGTANTTGQPVKMRRPVGLQNAGRRLANHQFLDNRAQFLAPVRFRYTEVGT